MAASKAILQRRSAELSSEFGLNYATELFGAEAIESLPRYTRGPKAGKPKGDLIWLRCTRGGWSPYGVAYPDSTVRAWIGANPYASESQALRGTWYGRTQDLCGSAAVLGEKNRAKNIAEGLF